MSTPRTRRRRPAYQLNNNTTEENVDVKVVHVPTMILHDDQNKLQLANIKAVHVSNNLPLMELNKSTNAQHQGRARVKRFVVNVIK